ncbi:MAG: hypothetical protein KDK64_07040 [Chlamydiia bacterium]|nr:hypothetical protein [Chlamydiia bacterium]
MSTQVDTQEIKEQVAAASLASSAAAKGSASMASVGVSTTAFLSALQAPSGAVGGDYSILSFILSEDESEEVQKTQAEQSFKFEQLSNQAKVGTDAADAPGAAQGTAIGGKNAVAESAALMSTLQYTAQKSLSTELVQEEEVLQDELIAAQKQEQLWDDFARDWKNYQDDPNNDNFQKLMKDIEGIYGQNSQQGKEAEQEAAEAQKAWDDEQHWQHESGWDRFKSGQWWDPKDWEHFTDHANGNVESLVGMAASTPGMFSLAIDNMSQMVKNRVQDLTLQIQFLQVIQQIVSGGGNAVVQMQALMNVMMQMGIANNEQSTSRNQTLNNFNIMSMTQQENKIDKQLKKVHDSEHHHGGILGFFEDIIHAIKQVFTHIFNVVEDAVSGNWKKLGHDLEKLTGVDKIMSALKEMFTGNFLKGFESLVASLVVGMMFGGLGFMLLDTKVGQDLTNCVKLVMDTVIAVVESLTDLVVAAAAKAAGDDSLAHKALHDAGHVWMKVAQNPELQLVLQVVMVVMIVAACLTGQFELAAVMAVLFVLTATGALTDMTEAMAKSMGNSAVDKVIADIITIVIVTVLTLGVGAAGAADSAAEVAADTASTAAKETTEESAEEAGETIAEGETEQSTTQQTNNESLTQKAGNKVLEGAKSLLKSVGSKTGAALMGFGTALMNTNFGYDLANAFIKKDKKKWEMILEIVNDIVGMIAAAGGGAAMAVSSAGSAADSAASSAIKKALPKLAEFFENNAAAMAEMGAQMQKAALLVGGIASVENGLAQIEQGEAYKKLQEFMAAMNQLNVSSDQLTSGMQHLTEQYKQLAKENEAINKNAYNAAAAGVPGDIRALMGQV